MKLNLDMENYEACPQFNDWLDQLHLEQRGTLDILGFQPQPSHVLFSLSPDTYQALFADFAGQRQEDLKQIVFNEFPTPIAHYFYRFENGYENELQRLHFLRDTWESIIDILHAIAVAECRLKQILLPLPLKFSHFLSDSVAQRLLNIERILQHSIDEGISLVIANLVSIDLLQRMRELNRTRNSFSHSAAQSETQARTWVGECYEDLMDVLDELRSLSELQILRYMGQDDIAKMRCEVFSGHSFTRTIKRIELTDKQISESRQYFHQEQVILKLDDYIFALRPLLFYREESSGHVTKLCVFRRTHGDGQNRQIEYEVVGEAERWHCDRALFQTELNGIRSLFGLGPD